jgi:hypothetical protein
MLQKYLDQLLFEVQDASVFQLAPSSENRAAWETVPQELRMQLERSRMECDRLRREVGYMRGQDM